MVWDKEQNPIIDSNIISELQPQLSVVDMQDYQVFQRDINGVSKNIDIMVSYSGYKATVQARIVDNATENVVIDWVDLPQVSTDTYSKSITVPQGGWYKIQARAIDEKNNTTIQTQTKNKWGVGINILCIGQSNMVGVGALASNTAANTDGRTSYTQANDLVANYSSGKWQHLVDPYDGTAGSMTPSLGNELSAKYKIPIGFIPTAASGSGLAVDPNDAWPNWITRNATDHYAYDSLNIYGRSITRAKAAGGAELIIINQGEHDVSMGTEQATYEQMFKTIMAYYYEDMYKNIPIFICQLGGSGSTIAAYAGKDDIMTGIRIAHLRLDNGENMYLASTEMELQKNKDEIHYTISSQDVIGKRVANAIMYHFGDSSYYRGPQIQSASFVCGTKTVVDVKIKHNGGNDFTPLSEITGFIAYDDETNIDIISATKKDATTITLTLSKSISGTGTIKHLYGNNPNVTGIIKDNSPLNLPLEATTLPIIIK